MWPAQRDSDLGGRPSACAACPSRLHISAAPSVKRRPTLPARAGPSGPGMPSHTTSQWQRLTRPRPRPSVRAGDEPPSPAATGTSSAQCMTKWGSASLARAGRLSQICRPRRQPDPVRRGPGGACKYAGAETTNIRSLLGVDLEEAEAVGTVGTDQRHHLAVDDAAAGRHPLAVAIAVAAAVAPGASSGERDSGFARGKCGSGCTVSYMESQWSTIPSMVAVIVSNPRCGCCGNPGMRSP